MPTAQLASSTISRMSAPRPVIAKDNQPMLLEGKRIFIVEDNIHNRIVFNMVLSAHGASVYFDPHGRDPQWRQQAFKDADLIILDLMLWRGQSGYELFDEIRAMPDYNGVPIVAVSASEPAVALPTARAKGFSGFIAKPIDDEHFATQIAAIINGEQVWFSGERF